MIVNSGSGVLLPVLTNPARDTQILSGTQAISQDGDIINGIMRKLTPNKPTITIDQNGRVVAQYAQTEYGYISPGTTQEAVSLSSAHDPDFKAENIKQGVSLFGVVGTLQTAQPVETCTLDVTFSGLLGDVDIYYLSVDEAGSISAVSISQTDQNFSDTVVVGSLVAILDNTERSRATTSGDISWFYKITGGPFIAIVNGSGGIDVQFK